MNTQANIGDVVFLASRYFKGAYIAEGMVVPGATADGWIQVRPIRIHTDAHTGLDLENDLYCTHYHSSWNAAARHASQHWGKDNGGFWRAYYASLDPADATSSDDELPITE